MSHRVFAFVLTAALALPAAELSASGQHIDASTQTERAATPATVPPDETFNEFLPEDRSLGECISAVQKPGCGSKARGGWRQGLVLLVILSGLGVILWRIVRASRRARLSQRPAATTVPTEHGDDPAS